MLKQTIYEIMEDDVKESVAHSIFESFIVLLIILNTFAIVIESVSSNKEFLRVFEIFSITVFTIEYFLRIYTSSCKYPELSKGKAAIKFIFSAIGLIDLLSILPFYLSFHPLIMADGRVLRVIRLLRLTRLMKLHRYLDSLKLIQNVFKKRKNELIVTAFIAFLLIIIASILMYEIEKTAQPDKFPDVISAFWWAIATLTTIGYGDIYPITTLGKVISAIISLIGIGFIALPTAIISTSFLDEIKEAKNRGETEEDHFMYCPHCGKKLKEDE